MLHRRSNIIVIVGRNRQDIEKCLADNPVLGSIQIVTGRQHGIESLMVSARHAVNINNAALDVAQTYFVEKVRSTSHISTFGEMGTNYIFVKTRVYAWDNGLQKVPLRLG